MKSWGVHLPHDLVMNLGLESGSIVSRNGGLQRVENLMCLLAPGLWGVRVEQDAVESRMRHH